MDENVKKVPRRLVGCRGDGTFEPSGVVGELGTIRTIIIIEISMCIRTSPFCMVMHSPLGHATSLSSKVQHFI